MDEQELKEKVSAILNKTGAYKMLVDLFEISDYDHEGYHDIEEYIVSVLRRIKEEE